MKLFTAITSLLALLAIATADGSLGGLVYAPEYSSLNYYTYPSYAFDYAVRDPHTGDNKAQWEKRDGDLVTGAYSLVEPDGTIRVVEYRADDKSGFNAVVKRIGPNLHPVSPPIYKAPIPILGDKLISPFSIGPVAGLKGLSGAPLLTGPLLGGAVSSASLYRSGAPLLNGIGSIAPIAHTLPAPILPLPIIKEPTLGPIPGPIIKGPLLGPLPAPIWKEPLLQPLHYGRLLPASIWKEPLLGPLPHNPLPQIPIWKEPLLGPLPHNPLPQIPIWKGPQIGPLPILRPPILPPILPHTPVLPSLPISKPLLWSEPILKPGLLPYLPLLKGPVDLPALGKWNPGGSLDYDLLAKGLLVKDNMGWGH